MSAVMSRPLADCTSTDLRSIDELDAAIGRLVRKMNSECYQMLVLVRVRRSGRVAEVVVQELRRVARVAQRDRVFRRRARRCALKRTASITRCDVAWR